MEEEITKAGSVNNSENAVVLTQEEKVLLGKDPKTGYFLKSNQLGGQKQKGQRDFKTIYREAITKLAEKNGKDPDELEMELVASGFLRARKDFRFYKDTLDRVHGQAMDKKEIQVSGTVNVHDPKTIKLAEEYEQKLKDTL